LPRPLPYREVARRLRAAGFIEYRQRGSHVRFIKTTPTGRVSVTVPRHREVQRGTISDILRYAGLSVDEFENL